MKKYIMSFTIMMLFLSSCVPWKVIQDQNRKNLLKLNVGMHEPDVIAIMGEPTINEAYKTNEDTVYKVLYYYTDRKYADGNRTKDECTPLVFEDNILIGWGNEFRDSILLGKQTRNQIKPSTKIQSKLGTAWFVAPGLVVTNYHVIEGAKKLKLITPHGSVLYAKLAVGDWANDIALLKVESSQKLPLCIPLSDEQTHLGAKVFTIGYPHATVMGANPKLTDGIISSSSGLYDDPRTYQVTVPLQSGNSGGPLMNMNGEVIGIVSSKLDAVEVFKWTGDLPQSVNFAIKINYLTPLLINYQKGNQITNTLPRDKDSLENLVKRIKDSVLIIVAE